MNLDQRDEKPIKAELKKTTSIIPVPWGLYLYLVRKQPRADLDSPYLKIGGEAPSEF